MVREENWGRGCELEGGRKGGYEGGREGRKDGGREGGREGGSETWDMSCRYMVGIKEN